MSINTTLNSTVVFSCEAVTNDDLSIRVDGLLATDRAVINNGFSVTTNDGANGTKRGELQAIAYEHNNNTEVRCRAVTNVVNWSNTALLMIQG